MKKWILMSLVLLLLSGCVEVTTVSLKLLENAPRKVEKAIQPDITLQLIEKNKDSYYIVYRSVNDVQMLPGNDGEDINISISEEPSNPSEMKTYIYELMKKNASEEDVRVYRDGHYMPFDVRTKL